MLESILSHRGQKISQLIVCILVVLIIMFKNIIDHSNMWTLIKASVSVVIRAVAWMAIVLNFIKSRLNQFS